MAHTPEMMPEPGDERTTAAPEDIEGQFDDQLALPLQVESEPRVFDTVVKRNGQTEPFEKQKIADAIFNAAESVGGQDRDLAQSLASAVTIFLSKRLRHTPPTVDQVHDAVERVLIQMSHARTALAYARYRDRRSRIRRLRDGDMRVLLSELVEAQLSPTALATRRDHALLVRTQNDSATWNRERIVEALVRETGLDKAPAMMIALEVEQQIERAGLNTLTASLVREMVGAKLIEHGMEAYREPYRRLGMSVYDCGRILRGATEDTLERDPVSTDRAIAWAAKREYALTEVFSSEVAEAHHSGALHLRHVERIDRLLAMEHDVREASQLQHGPCGISLRAVPPEDPDLLLAEIMRWHVRHERFLSDRAGWRYFNILVAPCIKIAGHDAIAPFARQASIDFAYHWLISEQQPVETHVELHWTTPPALATETALYPGMGLQPQTYGAVQHTAQKLAWAMVEHARNAATDGIRPRSPHLVCVLGPHMLEADGALEFVRLGAEAAAEGARISFRFDRSAAPSDLPRVTAHEVVLNLPQMAYRCPGEIAFRAELDRVLTLAFAAHEEKFNFLSLLVDPEGQGPLSALAHTLPEANRLRPEECAYRVALDGLQECMHYLGGGKADSQHGQGRQLIEHVRRRCEEAGQRLGIHLLPTENRDATVSARFAALDMTLYPESARATLSNTADGATPTYTTGVALPPVDGRSPVEHCRLEGPFKALLSDPSPSCIRMPMRDTDGRAMGDTIQKCCLHTPSPGLRFALA